MPRIDDTPINLRPYRFFGLDLTWRGKTQAEADCIFCDSEGGKFRVNPDSGLFRCVKCSREGNPLTFMRQLYEMLCEHTSGDYEELATDRKLIGSSCLKKWGIVWNHLTATWMIPGHGADEALNNLYKYAPAGGSGKRICLCPPTFTHQLFGVPVLDKKQTTVFLTEGWGDGIALWEALQASGRGETVLAIPSSHAFSERWVNLFSGRTVYLMCQSDHPNEQTKESASYAGMLRAARIMCTASPPPKEIKYLAWGPDNYDPSKPHGYDIRDFLSQGTTARTRTVLTTRLIDRLRPLSVEQIGELSQDELDCLPCDNWKELINAWRKALKWNDGLEAGLATALACCISTELQGDSQLWIKLVGPPSSGKSTLCEALSINKRYCLPKSNIRGFHSGFQTDFKGEEDHSLISQMHGKTLIIKDGDTLMKAPNCEQILAEARDVFDGNSRVSYRNRIKRDYERVRSTLIIAGTSSLRSLDKSELGDRFLTVIAAEKVPDEEEREVGWRVVNQAFEEMDSLANGDLSTSDDPAKVHAKQLTGGYLGYLRSNVDDLIRAVQVSDDAKERCQNLALFISYVRARPSEKQDEIAERELSYRLIKQIARLAKCLAVVLNRTSLDAEVMRRVTKVAMDTANGKGLQICRAMRTSGESGMTAESVSLMTNRTPGTDGGFIRFMGKIGICEKFLARTALRMVERWRLTRAFTELYDSVHKGTEYDRSDDTTVAPPTGKAIYK